MPTQQEQPEDSSQTPAAAPGSPQLPDAMIQSKDPKPVSELTPEEQMALYEDSLKDTDWGHQPC